MVFIETFAYIFVGIILVIFLFIVIITIKHLTSITIIKHPYTFSSSHDKKLKAECVAFAGSFNPPHLGHISLLKALSQKYKIVYAIIGFNPSKYYSVSARVRCEILEKMIQSEGLNNVKVILVNGHIWRAAYANNVTLMFRGIRSWKGDGNDELQLYFLNTVGSMILGFRIPIHTIFLQSSPEFENVSSTLIRSEIKAGHDISHLVPSSCVKLVTEAYS
eukprot:c19702_g1_i2.p1 GENE.c19702_g1_i2~~c19702_g1_i2.p1  ORF type:complete len:219 (+),score=67.96 c19702_g1_i2:17-673(+)